MTDRKPRPRTRGDLTLYDRHGHAWWDDGSPAFASLRRISSFRSALLELWCGERLPGADVVDLGCGGGLMAEPLAARGASVLGIDASLPSLRCTVSRGRSGCRYVQAGTCKPMC